MSIRARESDLVAAIAAATGMPPATVARIRRRLHMCWRPADVEQYMDAGWFAYERADRPDPEIRL